MQEKLRVLFSIGSLSGGGSERQLVTLLKHIDRTRFTPLLYLIYRQGELLGEVPDDVPIFAFEDRCPSSVWMRVPGLAHRLRVQDMARVLQEQQVDVSYDRTFHMTLVAGPATRQAAVPRISVAVTSPRHDVGASPERFVRTKKRLLRKWYASADRVVAVSEGVRSGLLEVYGLRAEQVVRVYNPIDTHRVRSQAMEPIDAFAQDKFHVVSGGRLHQQKGQHVLVQAMDQLVHERRRTDVHLHLVGSGPLEGSLLQFIRDRHLESHVTLYGFRANPHPYYRAASLFCLPSLVEGMPNALVEAMVLGTPVLSTDCDSGPREVLADGKYGRLVPVGRPDALADAVLDAMQNESAWKSRAAQAQQYAEDKFSLATGIGQTESLLLQLALRTARNAENT